MGVLGVRKNVNRIPMPNKDLNELKWIYSSKQVPQEYNKQIIGYTFCSCGSGRWEGVHLLNCKEECFITIYFKGNSDTDYKDYWSPWTPDFWMPFPDIILTHDDCGGIKCIYQRWKCICPNKLMDKS